jgi:DNA-binding transcriptional regulator LsrR (DeoR family)
VIDVSAHMCNLAHMSIDSKVVMAHVARLHYVSDLPKRDIAERLGISRFKVARLIDQAREEGIVRFQIREPLEVDDVRSRAVEEAYGLDLAVVVRDRGDGWAIARAAAAWLPDLTAPDEPVGVAWGTTLQQVADALDERSELRAPVVQVCGTVPGLEPGTGPAELAMRFAGRFGGRLYALPAPALMDASSRAALLANDAVRPTVEMFDSVGLTLVGIGRADRFPGSPPSAAGHLLVHLYDDDGDALEADTPERAIAMSREQMNRARVMAVAGGEGKERAIAGALRSGLLDALVTDVASAAFALDAV